MNRFKLQLDTGMSGAVISNVATAKQSTNGDAQEKPSVDTKILQDLAATLVGHHKEALERAANTRDEIFKAGIECGMEAIRVLLGDDCEAIQQRLKHLIETALEHEIAPPNSIAWIHPDVFEEIREWSVAAKLPVEIKKDDSLLVTDLRFEMDTTGALASLDSQIEFIKDRLHQSSVSGGPQ